MAHDLILAPEAETDVVEAYEWYEAAPPRTGRRISELRGCSPQWNLCTPDLHAIAFSNYRRALVRRFPYAMFYEVVDELVTVYGGSTRPVILPSGGTDSRSVLDESASFYVRCTSPQPHPLCHLHAEVAGAHGRLQFL
ncbi:MAG: hypothetical protein U0935_09355 [Pirellulales bacterium]